MKIYWIVVASIACLVQIAGIYAGPSGQLRKEQRYAQRVSAKKAKKDMREYKAFKAPVGVRSIADGEPEVTESILSDLYLEMPETQVPYRHSIGSGADGYSSGLLMPLVLLALVSSARAISFAQPVPYTRVNPYHVSIAPAKSTLCHDEHFTAIVHSEVPMEKVRIKVLLKDKKGKEFLGSAHGVANEYVDLTQVTRNKPMKECPREKIVKYISKKGFEKSKCTEKNFPPFKSEDVAEATIMKVHAVQDSQVVEDFRKRDGSANFGIGYTQYRATYMKDGKQKIGSGKPITVVKGEPVKFDLNGEKVDQEELEV